MIPVKKIKNACFMACIESFLRDHGIQIEQDCMIKMLRLKGLCSDEGVVSRGMEKEACSLFNIHFSDVKYHYPINPIYIDGSLLIGTIVGGSHCVRFYKQEEINKIIVMDPEFGILRYWDNMDQEKPNYHRIELL